MPKKKVSAPVGGSQTPEAATLGPTKKTDGEAVTIPPTLRGKKPHTISASSGKFFVLSNVNYPDLPPAELAKEIVSATDGDLIELLAMQNGWGYGKRFRTPANGVSEGVFLLNWVHGVKMVYEDGERIFMEVPINDPDYGFRPQAPTDTPGKLRLKRQHKKMEDAGKIWNKIHSPSSISPNRIKKAVRAATALEHEEECRSLARKRKMEAKTKKAASGACHNETTVPTPPVSLRLPVPADLTVSSEELQNEYGTQETIEDVKASVCMLVEQPVNGVTVRHSLHELTVESESRSSDELTTEFAKTPQTSSDAESQAFSPLMLVGSVHPSGIRRCVAREVVWEARWEQQAAHLEALFSASSSTAEDSESDTRRRAITVQRKMVNRRFTRSLLQAKRSGELQAITADWERAQKEMVNTTEKVKRSLLDANEVGDLESIAEEMADVAETKAAEVRALKERVFHAMSMAQSKDLEETTSDMEDAQRDLEMKAFQIKRLMRRAFKGMCESKKLTGSERSTELERIADEMSEQLTTRTESIKQKIRSALLRAHRAGQLRELRNELDEMADSVTAPLAPSRAPTKKMWADFSSDSESSDRYQAGSFANLSGYEADSSPNIIGWRK